MYRDFDVEPQAREAGEPQRSPQEKERGPVPMQSGRTSREAAPERTSEDVRDKERTVYVLRDRSYTLTYRQERLLLDVGRFRAIAKGDLAANIYKGDRETFERQLTQLHRRNLIRIVSPKNSVDRYVVLAKPARELAERYLRTDSRQQIYHGAAKLNEIKHDSALYRLYEKVAADIHSQGGRPLRVTLDYEFKQRINRQRQKEKRRPREQQQALALLLERIARQENLKVVAGKIPLPDLRIEYETAEGSIAFCDLEYVTDHYRRPSLAQKRAAGFQMFHENRRGRHPYGPDLMGGIISL